MISILLIDHAIEPESGVWELLAASRPSNFKVDRVLSYREILRGFRSKAHDVCLIDSGFGNGLKLFAQGRGLGFTAPVVLVTANNAPDVLEALHCGIADCLIRGELDASRIERSICSVVEKARGAAFHIERERRYLALLDNADAIIYTHDLNGNITSVNRTGERLIGYSQQELLGLHISQLIDPAYRNRVRNMIEHTLDAQARTVEEVELLTKEGHNLAVTIGVHPIYRQGKAIEIQGIVTTLPGLAISDPQAASDMFASDPERHGWPNRVRQFNNNSELAGKPSLATEMIDDWSGPLSTANSILGSRNLHD